MAYRYSAGVIPPPFAPVCPQFVAGGSIAVPFTISSRGFAG